MRYIHKTTRRAPVSDQDTIARIKAKCLIDDNGCWIWTGYKTYKGYGQISYKSQPHSLHRLMFMLHNGPIKRSQLVCHSCDVRACVNPSHLWIGSHYDNLHDCMDKGRHFAKSKTHCKHGHEFTKENTAITAEGHRRCKICALKSYRLRNGWPKQMADFAEQAESFGYVVIESRVIDDGRDDINMSAVW